METLHGKKNWILSCFLLPVARVVSLFHLQLIHVACHLLSSLVFTCVILISHLGFIMHFSVCIPSVFNKNILILEMIF